MREQLIDYLRVNIFLFIIIFLSCFIIIKNLIQHHYAIKDKFLIKKSINIFSDEPVLKTNSDLLFSFVLLFSIFLFVLFLGGNTGSDYAAYLFHLASPFLILTTFQFLKISNSKIFQTLVALLLIVTLRLQFKPKSIDFSKVISKYKETEDVIAKCKNVLNSSETVSIMLQQNKLIYNSGHSEYFQTGISELSISLGVSAGVEKRNNEFKSDLNEKIRKKEYDLILISEITKSFNLFIDQTNLIQNYQCIDTLPGPLSQIEAWYPKK